MGHSVRLVGGLTNAHGIVIEYDAKGRPVRFSGRRVRPARRRRSCGLL